MHAPTPVDRMSPVRRAPPALVPLLVAAATLGTALDAPGADDHKKQCVTAYRQAQELRLEGKLRLAREQMLACAQQTCPRALRDECVPWLAQVEASLPTVVLSAHDARARDLTAVKVYVDGQLTTERLDGRALPVDPGEHVFRFVAADGGSAERRVMIAEGQKMRPVVVQIGVETPPAPASGAAGHARPPVATAPVPAVAPPEPPDRPVPTAAWVLGGVGAAALGSFVGFALSGRAKENDMMSSCAPYCSQQDEDTMRRRYLVADISLGVSLVSLGAAAYLVLSSRTGPGARATATWLDARAAVGGAAVQVGGRF